MLFTYSPLARKLAQWTLPALYRGNGLECPCCDRRFRAFIPRHGVDSMCPGCLGLQRHRLLILYVMRELALSRLSVLHVAPEEGVQQKLKRLIPRGYVTMDASSTSIAETTGTITAIPFQPDSFDVVICSHVLEHVVEDTVALREFWRVLRPGGRALLMQPVHDELAQTVEDARITSPRDRLRAFGQHDHVRIYGRDFISRVIDAGFSVDPLDYLPKAGSDAVTRYGLGPETIYIATKPVS